MSRMTPTTSKAAPQLKLVANTFTSCDDSNYVRNIAELEKVTHIKMLVKTVKDEKFYINIYTAYKNGKKICVYTNSTKDLSPMNDINMHRLYYIDNVDMLLQFLCDNSKPHNFNNIVKSDMRDYVLYRSYVEDISNIKTRFVVKEFNYGTPAIPELEDLTIDFNDKTPLIKFEFDNWVIQIHKVKECFTA